MATIPRGRTVSSRPKEAVMSTIDHEAPPRTAGAAPAPLPSIPGKYLSLTTFRRDSSGVATPVWFVEDDGRLLVVTGGASYKARRLRRNPEVIVAPCTARGAVRGEPVRARAEFLPESEHARVDRLMARKYRVDRILILPIYRLAMRLSRRGNAVEGPAAYLSIGPAGVAE
jgi:PPOX class probable F420-dependent enzyme